MRVICNCVLDCICLVTPGKNIERQQDVKCGCKLSASRLQMCISWAHWLRVGLFNVLQQWKQSFQHDYLRVLLRHEMKKAKTKLEHVHGTILYIYIYIYEKKKKTLERSGKHTLTPYKYWQSFHKSHSAGLVIGNHALQMGQNLLLQPCLHIEVFSLLCKNLLHLAAENLSSDRRMPSCHSCPLKFGSSWCAASEHPLDSPWRHQCSWDDQMLWEDTRMVKEC